MLRNWQRVVVQVLPAATLGAIAFALVLAGTEPPGPGIDPDAVSYLGAAQSLAHSGSYRIPTAEWVSPDSTEALAHFPPGYSTVLAIPIALGVTPMQAGRLVDATAAFVTTATIVLLVTGAANLITAVLLAFALFAMTAMHEVHISILSEPTYLACTMLTLAAMLRWPARPLRAGIPAAIGALTRYAGISLVGAVALWALVRPGDWRQRITRAVIAIVPAMLLELAWVFRTRHAGDAEEIREFAVYGDFGATLREGARTLMAWLAPDPTLARNIPYRGLIAIAIALVIIALMWMGYVQVLRCAQDDKPKGVHVHAVLRACTILLICYLGIVTVSRLFADPHIPFDERILAPALLLAMIVIATTIHAWWRHARLNVARVAVAMLLAGWWVASAGATRLEARYALEWGSDFAGHEWRTSPLVAWARANAEHTMLYTNWPTAVYFYLHRNAHELPKHADPRTLQAFGDTIRARHAVVLLFGAPNIEYIPNSAIFKVPGLEILTEVRDGVVLHAMTP